MNFKRAMHIGAVALSVGCLAVFAIKIADRAGDVWAVLSDKASSPCLCTVELCLMTANILFEALRWRILHGRLERKSFLEDILSTLRAMAYGNATPGNIGEHAGRASGYADKGRAASVSIVGSILQTVVISIGGVIGLVYLWLSGEDVSWAWVVTAWALGIVCAEIVAATICIFFFDRIRGYALQAAQDTGVRRLMAASAVNALRFGIFSLQLYILLFGFCIYPAGFALVLVYYMLITSAPRINILDIGVKGSVGLLVFSGVLGEGDISAAILFLWIINIVLPSAAGAIADLVLRFRQRSSQ